MKKVILLIITTAISVYCCLAPVAGVLNIWGRMSGAFMPIVLFMLFVPTLFLLQSFFVKVPITKRWKFIFAMESSMLLAMFIFSFTLFGILQGIFRTTIHFYLIKYYVQIELLIFSLWTILLTTRFPNYRIITWPFVKKETGE
jgi:hypothetical protein